MSTVTLRWDSTTFQCSPENLAFSENHMQLALGAMGNSEKIHVLIDNQETIITQNAFEATNLSIKNVIMKHFLK